jgi:HD superfamily phosphohydrolase YqeK
MTLWSRQLGLSEEDRVRWAAAGQLHDSLKDAPVEALRPLVEPGWPDPLLHAPACAARLREEGVRDEELLLAISHHSTGHARFEALGECLYVADFLEPGRGYMNEDLEELRRRMPDERARVVRAVIHHRIARLLDRGLPLRQDTVRFWNRVIAA